MSILIWIGIYLVGYALAYLSLRIRDVIINSTKWNDWTLGDRVEALQISVLSWGVVISLGACFLVFLIAIPFLLEPKNKNKKVKW